ncbi:hypothetical protein MKW94_012162 [Papaver nudicaule]|uniref:UMP kinase n=1 Tax=Papaver nudicaule TaxID=74823 RepID=A0AA41SBD1_PAPNU|nr:hypothetical protein [Papaver nudicaule]
MASLTGGGEEEDFVLLTDDETQNPNNSNSFQNLHSFSVNEEEQNSQSEKRNRIEVEEEEPSNGITRQVRNETPVYKKTRSSTSNSVPVVGYYRGDSRKDREEWNDLSIECLLNAYTDKFHQLNRGILRGRDWEDIAAIVTQHNEQQKSSSGVGGGSKSVEQCKNKVDNMKKRYKVELGRMNSCGSTVSQWPWFEKIEQICINLAPPAPKHASEEDRAVNVNAAVPSSPNLLRQSKRFQVCSPSPGAQLANPRWKRVVFKVSGASLVGAGPQKTDPKVTLLIATEVARACRLGVEVAIVLGGRNFFCGDTWVAATGQERSTAYQLGMMATVMNSVLLQSALEKLNVQTRVQSAFPMQQVTEPYNKRKAIRHLEKRRVVIFGGIGAGTGNPLFTTDTAAALRASEINAEAVLKGTNVDGVHDGHSGNNSVAFNQISYREFLSRGVTSIDMMAVSFCEENSIPVVLFNLLEPGNISKALCGEQIGTLIDQSGTIS